MQRNKRRKDLRQSKPFLAILKRLKSGNIPIKQAEKELRTLIDNYVAKALGPKELENTHKRLLRILHYLECERNSNKLVNSGLCEEQLSVAIQRTREYVQLVFKPVELLAFEKDSHLTSTANVLRRLRLMTRSPSRRQGIIA